MTPGEGRAPATEKSNLAVIRAISEAAANRFDLDAVLMTCVTSLGQSIGADRCFIHLRDSKGHMPVTQEFVTPGTQPLGIGNSVLMPGTYLCQQTLTTITSDDALSDPRFDEAMDRHLLNEMNIKSVFSTPIMLKGVELGLLGAHHCALGHRWTDEEVELAEAVAAEAAVMIQSCRILAEQEKMSSSLAGMNEDLSRLYVELAEKDQQIDRFMYLISHDLRAPVVAIQGLVDMLKQQYLAEPPDSKPRRYLELIQRSAEQITGLTTALLEYARLGTASMRLEEIDTEELVRETWQRCSLGIPDVDLEIFGTLPPVRADRGKLSQILQNLFENAIKYRKPGARATVDITCQETEETWQFAVNDDGVGFPPAEAERIFDLFSRLKQSSSSPGTGIGLASVMELSRQHGGKAWATGRPGKGSTFYFTIARGLKERPRLPPAPGESSDGSGETGD